MARTYRKRPVSFESHISDWDMDTSIVEQLKRHYGEKWKGRYRAHYYGRTDKWPYMNLPKHHRKSVNRVRRRRDNNELHRCMVEDRDGLFDPWNCKTSNQWGYW